MKKRTVPGELSLSLGILLISIAVSLMVRAGFGISTISSLPYALTSIFPDIPFGTWNLAFQIGLLMILLAITRQFKSGYVISFVIAALFGFIADLFIGALSGLPTDIWCRSLYFLTSYLVLCFAISFMVNSKIPLMIVDAFIVDLARFFHVTFRRMKTLFDISCLSISVVLPMAFLGHLAGVGVGTVVLASITGAGVHAANKAISKAMVIRPWSARLGAMAK